MSKTNNEKLPFPSVELSGGSFSAVFVETGNVKKGDRMPSTSRGVFKTPYISSLNEGNILNYSKKVTRKLFTIF